MKLYPDQNDPAAPTRLGNTPVDEQEVIAAIASASDDENPTAMEFVITTDLLLRLYLPHSQSHIRHITETGEAVTKPELIGASNVLAMMADESDNIISPDYPQ